MFNRYIAVVVASFASASAQADLLDGGFESADPFGWALFQGGIDTPWRTTAPDNLIEIWNGANMGVPAYEGVNFAELNANYASTLYQDVSGLGDFQTINWKFAHRGRFGVDTMRLTITDLGWDQVVGGDGVDTVLFQQEFSADNLAWVSHFGSVVSIGNLTRFAFEAISAEGGSTQGNFLDDCGFGTTVIPSPGPASLMGIAGLLGLMRRRR